MALLSPVFFLMVLGIFELGLMLGAQQLLENAAFRTARLAKTGYTNANMTQTQTVNQLLVDELSSYGSLIDPAKVLMTGVAYGSFSKAGAGTGGVAGYGTAQQIVVYTVSYPWKLFTPMLTGLIGKDGYVTLTSTIVVRNEPY